MVFHGHLPVSENIHKSINQSVQSVVNRSKQIRVIRIINYTMSAAGMRETKKRGSRDLLMTLSLTTLTSVCGCFTVCFCCFSLSDSRKSAVISEWPLLLGNAPISTALRALLVLRIEIRLLRDTSRVLEYLSKKKRTQSAMRVTCM